MNILSRSSGIQYRETPLYTLHTGEEEGRRGGRRWGGEEEGRGGGGEGRGGGRSGGGEWRR